MFLANCDAAGPGDGRGQGVRPAGAADLPLSAGLRATFLPQLTWLDRAGGSRRFLYIYSFIILGIWVSL